MAAVQALTLWNHWRKTVFHFGDHWKAAAAGYGSYAAGRIQDEPYQSRCTKQARRCFL